jgi:hypothetical protein
MLLVSYACIVSKSVHRTVTSMSVMSITIARFIPGKVFQETFIQRLGGLTKSCTQAESLRFLP